MESLRIIVTWVTWLAVLGTVALSPLAHAAPTIYDNEPSFQAAATSAGVSLAEEGFESLTGPTSLSATPISLPAMTIVPVGGLFVLSTSGDLLSEGSQALVWDTGVAGVKFSLSSPVNAFALDIKDFGDVSPSGNMLFVKIDDGDTSAALFTGLRTPGNLLFLGVVDPIAPFSEILLTVAVPNEEVGLDRLQFGPATPVPAASHLGHILLACLLLARLAWVLRRWEA